MASATRGHSYDFKTIIHRLVNIVGPRSKHGVICDFIQKLKINPEDLEILRWNPKQILFVHDRLHRSMLIGLEETKSQVEIYNVSLEDQITVKTIAEIAVEEMQLKNVRFKFTGGADGMRLQNIQGNCLPRSLDLTRINSAALYFPG